MSWAGRVIYTPAALVHHLVPASRLSQRFFLRRGYAQGLSNILFQTETHHFRHLFLWHLRQVAVGMKLSARALVTTVGCCLAGRGKSVRFARRVYGMYALGYVVGAMKGAGRSLCASETQTPETTEAMGTCVPHDVQR